MITRLLSLTVLLSLVSSTLVGQELRISGLDRSGALVVTNTTPGQRYSLGGSTSVDGLLPGSLRTLQSRMAHGSSATFQVNLTENAAFFRVFLDPFGTADLAGHWTLQLLTVADDPGDWAGWGRFQMSIDALGTATLDAVERSNGDNTINDPTVSLSLASDGSAGGFLPNSPIMTLDKGTVVGVLDDGGGGCDLFTMVKRVSSGFAASDLQGPWTLFGVAFGIPPATWGGGWIRHELTFDSQGNGAFTSALRSNGDIRRPPAITVTVSSDGSGASSMGLPWVMASDKGVLWSVGNDPGGDGRGFYVLVKRAASGFTAADAEGLWTMFTLSTRDGPPAFAGWGRYELTVNAQGQATCTAAQRSNRDATLPTPFALSVGPDGTATGRTPPPVMTLDKNLVCGVVSEPAGSYSIYLMARR